MIKKKKSLFDVLLLNKEIDEKGKHVLEFPPEFPLIVREYTFNFEFPVKPNFHNYLEIIYILNNRATLQFSNKIYDVKKGDILIIGKNELHYCFQYKDEPVSLVSLKFMAELIYSLNGLNIDFEYLRPFYSKSSNFQNLITSNKADNKKILDKIYFIKETVEKQKKHYKIIAKTALSEILLEIIKFYDELPVEMLDEHYKHLQDLERLRKVFEFMNARCSDNISLGDAAGIIYLNKCYFSKFFKKVTGLTYSSYLQRIRVEKAKEFLASGDFSIARIAFLTGFNTINFFNKTFKKITRLTPTEYRNKLRQKEL